MNPTNSATTPAIDSEPWMNTTAACKHLSISVPTIKRWIKDGTLKPKRTPSGGFRYRRSELDAVLG